MKLLKIILFLGFSLFLIYQSFLLIAGVLKNEIQNFTILQCLTLSFLINLFITGIFAFPGFVLPTSKLLGKSYYQIRSPRKLIALYRYLGVDAFRKILLVLFWGKKKNRLKCFDGTRKGLENFTYQTKQSEFGHLVSSIVITFISILTLIRGYLAIFIMTTVINVIVNRGTPFIRT